MGLHLSPALLSWEKGIADQVHLLPSPLLAVNILRPYVSFFPCLGQGQYLGGIHYICLNRLIIGF